MSEMTRKPDPKMHPSYKLIIDLLLTRPEGLTIKQLASTTGYSISRIYSIVHSLRIWGYATLYQGVVKLKQSVSSLTTFDLQERLEEELEKLKSILKLGCELKVLWLPNRNKKLSGEVKGDIIHIYDEDEELTLETLKHEYIDFAISKVIEPYKEVTNKFISLINEQVYYQKEKLVEALSTLIKSN